MCLSVSLGSLRRLRLHLGKVMLLLLLLRRGEHLLLPLLLLHHSLLGLLLNHAHADAGLWADDTHAGVRRVHGDARLARLAGLLHEVVVWMGHDLRRVNRT